MYPYNKKHDISMGTRMRTRGKTYRMLQRAAAELWQGSEQLAAARRGSAGSRTSSSGDGLSALGTHRVMHHGHDGAEGGQRQHAVVKLCSTLQSHDKTRNGTTINVTCI
jgi:hypothetical protein